jgi:hypothetical protein
MRLLMLVTASSGWTPVGFLKLQSLRFKPDIRLQLLWRYHQEEIMRQANRRVALALRPVCKERASGL